MTTEQQFKIPEQPFPTMNDILLNLALIDLNNFCKENHIPTAGTRVVKRGRGFVYDLVGDNSAKRIASVQFHKNQVPTHQVF